MIVLHPAICSALDSSASPPRLLIQSWQTIKQSAVSTAWSTEREREKDQTAQYVGMPSLSVWRRMITVSDYCLKAHMVRECRIKTQCRKENHIYPLGYLGNQTLISLCVISSTKMSESLMPCSMTFQQIKYFLLAWHQNCLNIQWCTYGDLVDRFYMYT